MAKANIPIYSAEVSTDTEGMTKISLVTSPAVLADFVAFAEDKKPQMFAVENEDKHLVLGVVMRADFPIYRRNDNGFEYYLTFSKDTIRLMAEKYLADNFANAVNLQHADGSDVEGVQMVQWFIKDSANGISPAAFADIEDGSLFAEFHVSNDEVWEGIKAGEFKGFSLEGFFSYEKVAAMAQMSAEQVAEAVNNAFAQITAIPNISHENMTLIERMKAALAEGLAAEQQQAEKEQQMASIATDNGTLIYDADELAVGVAVSVADENGNEAPAADGEYKAEDKVYVVADGKIAEIKDAEQPAEGEGEGEGEQPKEGEVKAEIVAKFAALKEAFSYRLNDLYSKFYELLPDSPCVCRYVFDVFNDYVVMEEYHADNSVHYMRYDYSVDAEGNVTINGEGYEVANGWNKKDEQPAQPAEGEGGEAMAAELADIKEKMAAVEAEKADLEQKLAAAEAKLNEPQGKPAHEAFKSAEQADNPIKTAMKYIRK